MLYIHKLVLATSDNITIAMENVYHGSNEDGICFSI